MLLKATAGLLMAGVLAACAAPAAPAAPTGASATTAAPAVASAPGTGGTAIGFLFVGPKDDYGYNQAAYIGSEAVEKAMGDKYKVLRAENVPENEEAERVMENMIQQGAKIIFPTSYGHLDPAINVAKRHPDVVFMHQGGAKSTENVGAYFGTIWQPVYLSGVAAGKMSKTGKLGYIVAFPIPQTLLNINAFALGAQSVNPDATVNVVFTASWCDPAKQTEAVKTFVAAGVDVVTQHQDCAKAIVEAAERAGIMSVGYHADGSALAPKGWITGSQWDWGNLYVDIAKTIADGKFKGSKYDGVYREGFKEGVVKLSPFGAAVPEDVKKLVLEKQQEMLDGKLNPFTGPIKDQAGTVQIPEGTTLDTIELEAKTNYLVQGVTGTIPK
jgi:basic membrane lipoprotein Med (substrate-binding protein (PBP1-ABC) superfamily)